MKFRGFRLHIIVIACVVVIAVGFGAREFVFGRHMNKVVVSEFADLPGVEAVQLHDRGSGTDVSLRLGPEADFAALYPKASALATEKFGSDAALIIEDDRTEMLQAAFDRVHLALYEGAATGRFVEMERRVHELLSAPEGEPLGGGAFGNVEVRIAVDDAAIYIELSSDDGRLYERIGRRPFAAAGAFGGMRP